MNLRQAAQQALEALDNLHGAYRRAVGLIDRSHDDSATIAAHNAGAALRQALAEPEQEPVAVKQMLRWVEHLKRLSDDGQHMSIPGLSSGACWELAIELEQFIRTTAPTPQPKQEPVGWQWLDTANYRKKLPANAIREHWRPLYTAPTQRTPLSEEEIIDKTRWLCVSMRWPSTVLDIARAIEAAHGITGETK